MDTRILADNDAVAGRISTSLKRHGVDCPASHIHALSSMETNSGVDPDFCGTIFICAKQYLASHFESIRRIRAQADAETKIVVVSSVADHGIVLKAVRAGANDFLIADDSLDDEIGNFVRRVRLERKKKEMPGRVVSVMPCQSACDANVLSVNLAAVVATHFRSCGLLDFHFRGGDLALLLKITPQHTLLDLLNQRDAIDESMLEQAVSTHESGIRLLAGPPPFADIRNIGLQACQQIIELARRCWPILIINAEDAQHAEQIRALGLSDAIILTMRLDVASLFHAQKHVEFLVRNEIPRDQILVVAMGTGRAGELPVSAVKDLIEVNEICSVPDDPDATIMSINVGNPVVLENPNSKSATAIRRCAESIFGFVNKEKQSDGRPAAVKAAALLALNTLSICK